MHIHAEIGTRTGRFRVGTELSMRGKWGSHNKLQLRLQNVVNATVMQNFEICEK